MASLSTGFLAQRVLTSLLILFSIHSAGQESLQKLKDLKYSRFDYPSQLLIRVFEDHFTLSRVTGDSAVSFPVPGIGELVSTHGIHLLDGKLTLTKSGSGPVLQVSEGSIRRIDKSLDHQMQQHSLEFVRRDTLYRHGGYGLWEAFNILTYFNTTSFEWEIVQPLTGQDFPPGLFRHQGILQDDELYLFGGKTIDPFDPMEQVPNQEVWKFSFVNRQWYRLGQVHEQTREIDLMSEGAEWTEGAHRLAIYYDHLIMIDAGANRLDVHPVDQITSKAIPHHLARPFIHDGQLYYYHRTARPLSQSPDESPFDELDYRRIPISSITKRKTYGGHFYHDSISWWWLLAVLPIAVSGVFLARKKRRPETGRTKANVLPKGISYRGVDYEMDEVTIRVLTRLLQSQEDTPSSEIIEITSPQEKDYPNKVRIKNRLIRNLNLELRAIFRAKQDVIVQTHSAIDRRIKCYRIDRSFFQPSSKPRE